MGVPEPHVGGQVAGFRGVEPQVVVDVSVADDVRFAGTGDAAAVLKRRCEAGADLPRPTARVLRSCDH